MSDEAPRSSAEIDPEVDNLPAEIDREVDNLPGDGSAELARGGLEKDAGGAVESYRRSGYSVGSEETVDSELERELAEVVRVRVRVRP